MAAVHVSARDPRVQPFLSDRHRPPRTIVAEGAWAHRVLLDSGAEIRVVVTCPELLTAGDAALAAAVGRRAVVGVEVSERTYRRITRRNSGGGLASLVTLPPWSTSATAIGGRPIRADSTVLVADGVEYAHNLGALVRVVDASGAAGLLLTNRRAKTTHPDVFTASRGTVLTTPVVEFGAVAEARAWLRRLGFTVYVARPGAPVDHRSRRRDGRPAAIVVGAEGPGVGPEWLAADHTPISIPMSGVADSLNVAVAAGVLLFG